MAAPPRVKTAARPERTGRRVVVLLLPEVHLLDLAGPVQVFDEANGFGARYAIEYCATDPTVHSAQGLTLANLGPPPEPHPGMTVLVPGMTSTTLPRRHALPVDWLRAAEACGARLVSICSGAFAFARAGLLDGRLCTTHWKLVERLREEVPRARVLDDRLYVSDRRGQGEIVTSAGITSGIDLALALVEEDLGPATMGRVAREMVVYLRRAGTRSQESTFVRHRNHLHPGVHRVQDWIVEHPDRALKLATLSGVAAMSPRNLTRAFRRETGLSVREFSEMVRFQLARDLVLQTDLPLDDVAARCGLGSARTLRRVWTRATGAAPSAWRRRQAT